MKITKQSAGGWTCSKSHLSPREQRHKSCCLFSSRFSWQPHQDVTTAKGRGCCLGIYSLVLRGRHQRFPRTTEKDKNQKTNAVGHHLLPPLQPVINSPCPAPDRWCPAPRRPPEGWDTPILRARDEKRGCCEPGRCGRRLRGRCARCRAALSEQGAREGAAGSSRRSCSCPGSGAGRVSSRGRWRRAAGSGESRGARCECRRAAEGRGGWERVLGGGVWKPPRAAACDDPGGKEEEEERGDRLSE